MRKGRPEKVANAAKRAIKSGTSSVVTGGSKPRRVTVKVDVKPIKEASPRKRKRKK